MDVRIIVETTFENGTTKRHRLGRLSRPFRRTQPEGFGLLLEDAKTILGQLQNAILRDQIEEISEASRVCPDCDGVRAIHVIGRGCSTNSSAGSRSKRRAFAVAPAMQNPMLSWADRFRLSLTIFRIDRPRNLSVVE